MARLSAATTSLFVIVCLIVSILLAINLWRDFEESKVPWRDATCIVESANAAACEHLYFGVNATFTVVPTAASADAGSESIRNYIWGKVMLECHFTALKRADEYIKNQFQKGTKIPCHVNPKDREQVQFSDPFVTEWRKLVQAIVMILLAAIVGIILIVMLARFIWLGSHRSQQEGFFASLLGTSATTSQSVQNGNATTVRRPGNSAAGRSHRCLSVAEADKALRLMTVDISEVRQRHTSSRGRSPEDNCANDTTAEDSKADAVVDGSVADASEMVCIVCLDEIKPPSSLPRRCRGLLGQSARQGTVVQLPCDHVFHPDCIRQWWVKGHPQCPYCKFDIAAVIRRSSADHVDRYRDGVDAEGASEPSSTGNRPAMNLSDSRSDARQQPRGEQVAADELPASGTIASSGTIAQRE